MDNMEKSFAEQEFEQSIEAARAAGIPEDKILKSIDDIDRYFLDED